MSPTPERVALLRSARADGQPGASPAPLATAPKTAVEKLAEAAIAWNTLRLRALALRQARADEGCEQEAGYESETGAHAVPPCWRDYSAVSDGYPPEPALKPRDEWCEPCVRRQAIHEEYRAAVKQRGIELRRLERLALQAAAADAVAL